MTKSDLLTSISERAHLKPYSLYATRITEALKDAMIEFSLQVSTSDVQYLIGESAGSVTNSKVALPNRFAKIIKIKVTGSEFTSPKRFIPVDMERWQWLGVDSDYDPPPNTVYYLVNGSDILFYSVPSINGQTISITYLLSPDIDNWADNFELVGAGLFTDKFLVIVKNRAVEILTAEMRREQS